MTIRNMTLVGLLGVGITAGGCTNTAPPSATDNTAASPAQSLPATNASTAPPSQPDANVAPPAQSATNAGAAPARYERKSEQRRSTAINNSSAPVAVANAHNTAPPPQQVVVETAPPPQDVVEVAPPPVRFERFVPRPGYVWTPGYWRWDASYRRHVWVGGSYVSARPGFDWVPGHWEQNPNSRGWYFRGGYWARRGPGAPPQYRPGAGVGPGSAGGINVPPPPPRSEPAAQRPGFVWTPGYWQWNGNRYAWVPGSYAPARPGFYWVPGRWEQTPNRRWHFDQGHWAPRDAGPPVGGSSMGNGYVTVAPPAPRIEPVVQRPGMVWTPGYWRWDGGHYAWVNGNYVPARPGWIWVPHRWVEGPRGGWHLQPGHWQRRP